MQLSPNPLPGSALERPRLLPALTIAKDFFDGAVFDLDDLLIGTQRLAKNPGFHLPLYAEAIETLIGNRLSELLRAELVLRIDAATSDQILPMIHRTLIEFGVHDFSAATPEELGARIAPIRAEAILNAARRGECPLLPGGSELISELAAQGKSLAIYSSNRRSINGELIKIVFDESVFGRFNPELILFGDDVVKLGGARKPHPFGFLELSRRMRIPAGRLIAFDDSCEGLNGALDAEYGLVIGVDGGKQADFSAIAGRHRLALVHSLMGVQLG